MCGAFDIPGFCEPIPDPACNRDFLPVCGCDGMTYDNECRARVAATSVAYFGECDGSMCINDTDRDGICDVEDNYCNLDASEPICEIVEPQCGFGEVIEVSNGCYGECVTWRECARDPEEGQLCGSRGLPMCPRGTYCRYDIGASCGDFDLPGTCAPRGPGICPDVYMPVCGCNGQTYGNQCEANAAGASVRSEGECMRMQCGGFAGIQCPEGMICVDDPTDNCDPNRGGADCIGVCEPEL